MTNSISNAQHLKDEQYKTSANLKMRMALYEHSKGPKQQSWHDFVLDHLALEISDRVIDFGCGHAVLWQKLKEIGSLPTDLTLVDLSEGMLQEARAALGDDPTYIAHDLNQPLETDQTYDALIALHMLYHLDDPLAGLDNMVARLNSKGSAYIGLNQPGGFREMYRLINRFETRETVPSQGINPPPHPDVVVKHLKNSFERNETIVSEGAVYVSNAKPLCDYILSMETLHGNRYQDPDRRDALFAFLTEEVVRAVNNDGALILRKAAVLLKFDGKK